MSDLTYFQLEEVRSLFLLMHNAVSQNIIGRGLTNIDATDNAWLLRFTLLALFWLTQLAL